MNKKYLILKWPLLVLANTLWGLAIALDKVDKWQGRLGIALGILVFVLFYYYIDTYLKKHKFLMWQKALQRGVILNAIILLVPYIPIITGVIALDTVSKLLVVSQDHDAIIHFFLVVLLDGLLLSIFAMIPILFMWLILNNSQKRNSL